VDLTALLAELRRDRRRLDQAIAALEALTLQPTKRKRKAGADRRPRTPGFVSPARPPVESKGKAGPGETSQTPAQVIPFAKLGSGR
jgi:hypothetical protein